MAWLDRREERDARDLALAVHWMMRGERFHELLEEDLDLCTNEGFDQDLVLARDFGRSVAAVVGATRIGELRRRCDEVSDLSLCIARGFVAHESQMTDLLRRTELVEALLRGLFDRSTADA
jgi:predicted nucleotidyltransferase